MRLKNISIRNRIVLIQVSTSVLVLIVFFIAFIVTDINNYKQRKVATTNDIAQVIAVNSISTLQFRDNDAAQEILRELRRVSPDIVYAGIMDSTGALFAQYKEKAAENVNYAALVSHTQHIFTDDALVVADDIRDQHQKIGTVVLAVNLSELNGLIQSKYKAALLLFLLAIGFSLLLAAAFQNYVSRRLLQLVNTMKTVIASGNFKEPIVDDGADEISTLIHVYNTLMQQIQESQAKKDEFVGVASHELKTPLTSIKGYMQLLDRIETNQLSKTYLQKALNNIHKLELLIQDLLDVSKIQMGQMQLNIMEFNIEELVTEVVVFMRETFSHFEIVSETCLSGQIIRADRNRIEQVLINLLSNAVKYSGDQPRIILNGRVEAGELIIQVRDFGVGIPATEREHIFERFYRTKDVSVNISGFGLGLYICRSIIMRHHGNIWVEGEDRGTSFYFSLPLNGPGTEEAESLSGLS